LAGEDERGFFILARDGFVALRPQIGVTHVFCIFVSNSCVRGNSVGIAMIFLSCRSERAALAQLE